jgi:hypothetical protein
MKRNSVEIWNTFIGKCVTGNRKNPSNSLAIREDIPCTCRQATEHLLWNATFRATEHPYPWGEHRPRPSEEFLSQIHQPFCQFVPTADSQPQNPQELSDVHQASTVLSAGKKTPVQFSTTYSTSEISDILKKDSEWNSVAWVREQTILTERPPLVGEVSANFGR